MEKVKEFYNKVANSYNTLFVIVDADPKVCQKRILERGDSIEEEYHNMDDLIEVCVPNMVSENFSEEAARAYLKQSLPTLDYWKRYAELSDNGQFEEFKQKLTDEINELHIEGMPEVKKLNSLVGKYVNLEYPLPSGVAVRFLNDSVTYLGTQLESEIVDGLCFGVLLNGALHL